MVPEILVVYVLFLVLETKHYILHANPENNRCTIWPQYQQTLHEDNS